MNTDFPKYLLGALGFSAILAGCAPIQPVVQYREVSDEEAFSFIAKHSSTDQLTQHFEPTFIQPQNKDVQCKIEAVTEEQITSSGKTFWSGECKNGYAHGLGTFIYISDSSHFQSVLRILEAGRIKNTYSVVYDYVNDIKIYRHVGGNINNGSYAIEKISNENSHIIPVYNFQFDDTHSQIDIKMSPYLDELQAIYTTGDLNYIYIGSSNDFEYWQGTHNRRTNQYEGFAVRKFKRGGAIDHVLIDSNGNPLERVSLPASYLNHLNANREKVSSKIDEIPIFLNNAEQLEKEFIYKTCERGQKDRSIDSKLQSKICSWTSERLKSLEIAKEQHNKKLELQALAKEQERQRLENEMQNRRIIEALEQQAQAARSANSINRFNQLQQQINQLNEETRSRGQQMMLYNQMNQLNQNLNKTTNCITNFGITTCF